jgi:NitT/TauT family transport system permease protein
MPDTTDLEALKRQVSDAAAGAARRARRRLLAGRLALLLALLGLWEALSGRLLDPFFVSSPRKILAALYLMVLEDELLWHAQLTTVEAVGGYLVGSAVGVLLAFAATNWGQLYKIVEPFVLALNGIPRIALAPLFIMWFGLGLTPKIVIAGLLVFFIVFMNTVSGIQSASPQLIDLARLMGAGRMDVLRKIVLPSALPFILTSLRIVVPTAMIGAIVGEFISAQKGLGFVINRASFEYQTGAAFAGIAVLLAVVVVLNALVSLVEARLMRWRPSGQAAPAPEAG